MPTPSGYSGTPLAKKLGIKPGFQLWIKNPPVPYTSFFNALPDDVTILDNAKKATVDFVHLFCTTYAELEVCALECKSLLKKTGMLWVSWPKGSSKIPTDLKRDPIREYLLKVGLVDVKVAAVNEDWSGLKFVYRTKDR
ncbi:MAG: DUF3052 domain-containing protein [Bacteroidota bacterium]